MSANRKLLGEIQQVLKKVEEGVEIFDEIWEKVYAAEQQSLKEKYEADLKKEIKKLQRLRDQIKTWISSSEIKDKSQLTEVRKTIESKMEQFKICEKDTKTKAYSKEGLARDAKLDPKDALKEEKRNWLNESLDKLNDLIDSVEAEREKLLGSSKGKSKHKDALEKFDNRVQKHKWHMAKLEAIIKLLDGDDLDPALVSGIQDSLDYYIESAADDDGALGVEHEFDIYEELELENLLGAAIPTFELSRPHKDEESSPVPAAASESTENEITSSLPTKKGASSTSTAAAKTKVDVSGASASAKSVSSSTKVSSKPNAAVTAVNKAAPPTKSASKSASTDDQSGDQSENTPSASVPVSSGMSWAAHAASAVPSTATTAPTSVPSTNTSVNPTQSSKPNPPTTNVSPPGPPGVAAPVAPVIKSSTVDNAVATSHPVIDSAVPQTSSTATVAVTSTAASTTVSSQHSPTPSPQLPSQPSKTNPELQNILAQLNQSVACSPENMELERQSSLLQYNPRNLYPGAHPAFPSLPQFTTQTEIADLFERLPMDTLFFVFYFQQGTYQQYLAAKQLKKHSWRFHKKYMTWFQRHEEPKIATEEYEEGTYVYFDYESGWCQRIKSEFKFEYAYLEDELGAAGDA